MKSKDFVNKPGTIHESTNSRHNGSKPKRVVENWNFRMDHIQRSRGEHSNLIIFNKKISEIVV